MDIVDHIPSKGMVEGIIYRRVDYIVSHNRFVVRWACAYFKGIILVKRYTEIGYDKKEDIDRLILDNEIEAVKTLKESLKKIAASEG